MTSTRDESEKASAILARGKYNVLAPELFPARTRAFELTSRYNQSFGQPDDQRAIILRQIVRSAGDQALFQPTFRCEFGFNIVVGDRVFVNFDCTILDAASVEIGDDVLIAPRVSIYTSQHAIDPEERASGLCRAEPVRIGRRVWIGGGVHINPGVTIGENSIIGSGSVVTGDIPPNVIASGVPARVARQISEKDKTER